MSAARITPGFVAWLAERGLRVDDVSSPPVLWGYITLYNRARQISEDERECARDGAAT